MNWAAGEASWRIRTVELQVLTICYERLFRKPPYAKWKPIRSAKLRQDGVEDGDEGKPNCMKFIVLDLNIGRHELVI